MPIYHMKDDEITKVKSTTLESQGLRERQDLQRLLKKNIQVISPDTLIVKEEFSEWKDSNRRIDLLGVDSDANLVVIELKCTPGGGHMDLQAIRYAAMSSTLTFEKLVPTYSKYLEANGIGKDAEKDLLDFLGWDEPDEKRFGQKVKIVLALASNEEFSRELTTMVMWLNNFNLDISCVHLHPYCHNGDVLLDVRNIIPLPEVAEYQVSLREKEQKTRESHPKDYTKYDLTINLKQYPSLNKRKMMLHIVKGLLNEGTDPQQIMTVFPKWGHLLFAQFSGELDAEKIGERFTEPEMGDITHSGDVVRFFSEEPFYFGGCTYVLSSQWGSNTYKGRFDAPKAAEILKRKFPALGIEIKAIESD